MAHNLLQTYGHSKLLFLMAAEAEYGSHLQKLFTPFFIGVGPIEAAVQTTAILAKLEQENALPDYVVSIGSSGSAKLKQTHVYQISSVSWRDMDATLLGVEKGVTPFLDLPAVVELPCLLPDVECASLSTGGNVVSGKAYDDIDADMVDMETFAIMRACQHFGVKLIGFRGVSDGQDELKCANDWRQYLHIVDEKLALVIEKLKENLEAGLSNK